MSRYNRVMEEFSDDHLERLRRKRRENGVLSTKDLDSKGLLQRARNSRYGMDRNHSSRNYDSGEMTARSGKSHSTETGSSSTPMNYTPQNADSEELVKNSIARKHKKMKKFIKSEIKPLRSGSDTDSSVHRLVQNLENTEEKLLEKYNELDEQNKDLIYYNRRTKHEIDDLKKEVAHLKTQLEVTLKNELQMEEKRAKELERKLLDAKQIFENSAKFRSKEISDMKKKLEVAEAELAEADLDNKTLKSKCSILEKTIADLQDNISVRKEHEDILLKNMTKILMERESRLSNDSRIRSELSMQMGKSMMSAIPENESSNTCCMNYKF